MSILRDLLVRMTPGPIRDLVGIPRAPNYSPDLAGARQAVSDMRALGHEHARLTQAVADAIADYQGRLSGWHASHQAAAARNDRAAMGAIDAQINARRAALDQAVAGLGNVEVRIIDLRREVPALEEECDRIVASRPLPAGRAAPDPIRTQAENLRSSLSAAEQRLGQLEQRTDVARRIGEVASSLMDPARGGAANLASNLQGELPADVVAMVGTRTLAAAAMAELTEIAALGAGMVAVLAIGSAVVSGDSDHQAEPHGGPALTPEPTQGGTQPPPVQPQDHQTSDPVQPQQPQQQPTQPQHHEPGDYKFAKLTPEEQDYSGSVKHPVTELDPSAPSAKTELADSVLHPDRPDGHDQPGDHGHHDHHKPDHDAKLQPDEAHALNASNAKLPRAADAGDKHVATPGAHDDPYD